MEMIEALYELGRSFPPEERFGLTSQLQRAGVSVPANIAEGWGRSYRKEYIHHLSMAKGSLMEVETHLLIAMRLQFTTKESAKRAWDLSQEVGKMLTSLIATLGSATKRPT
jgi:four helix bundle protein